MPSEQTGAAHFLAPLSTGVCRMAISAFCTDLFFPGQAKTVSHREWLSIIIAFTLTYVAG